MHILVLIIRTYDSVFTQAGQGRPFLDGLIALIGIQAKLCAVLALVGADWPVC